MAALQFIFQLQLASVSYYTRFGLGAEQRSRVWFYYMINDVTDIRSVLLNTLQYLWLSTSLVIFRFFNAETL